MIHGETTPFFEKNLSSCQNQRKPPVDRVILNDTLVPNKTRYDTDGSSLPGSWVVGDAHLESNTVHLEKGVLFPYVRTVKSYHGPGDRTTVEKRSNLLRNRSYTIDGALGEQVR